MISVCFGFCRQSCRLRGAIPQKQLERLEVRAQAVALRTAVRLLRPDTPLCRRDLFYDKIKKSEHKLPSKCEMSNDALQRGWYRVVWYIALSDLLSLRQKLINF